jgi:hydrogenase/urease accessory protein HupE
VARLEARDIIALVIVVGTLVALILRAISPEQAITVIMAILAYYFGYGYGYERGVSSARREKVA